MMLDLEALKAFQLACMDDLLAARQIALNALEAGRLPDFSAVPQRVLVTGATALFLAQFLFLLLVAAPFRRMVFAVVDTVLALILILLLLALVLGMPFGVLYIAAQGSYHLSSSLLHTFSPLKEGANLVLGALGQPQLL